MHKTAILLNTSNRGIEGTREGKKGARKGKKGAREGKKGAREGKKGATPFYFGLAETLFNICPNTRVDADANADARGIAIALLH